MHKQSSGWMFRRLGPSFNIGLNTGLSTAFILGLLLAAGCLGYSAWYQAPVNDEFGHFYAGLRYWQFSTSADDWGDVYAKRLCAAASLHPAGLSVSVLDHECGQCAGLVRRRAGDGGWETEFGLVAAMGASHCRPADERWKSKDGRGA